MTAHETDAEAVLFERRPAESRAAQAYRQDPAPPSQGGAGLSIKGHHGRTNSCHDRDHDLACQAPSWTPSIPRKGSEPDGNQPYADWRIACDRARDRERLSRRRLALRVALPIAHNHARRCPTKPPSGARD